MVLRAERMLLLLDDGRSCVEIAQVLYLDDDTVRGWHKHYLAEGWDSVAYDGWKGGQSRMSVAQARHPLWQALFVHGLRNVSAALQWKFEPI